MVRPAEERGDTGDRRFVMTIRTGPPPQSCRRALSSTFAAMHPRAGKAGRLFARHPVVTAGFVDARVHGLRCEPADRSGPALVLGRDSLTNPAPRSELDVLAVVCGLVRSDRMAYSSKFSAHLSFGKDIA
jgi:hypothetical protein